MFHHPNVTPLLPPHAKIRIVGDQIWLQMRLGQSLPELQGLLPHASLLTGADGSIETYLGRKRRAGSL